MMNFFDKNPHYEQRPLFINAAGRSVTYDSPPFAGGHYLPQHARFCLILCMLPAKPYCPASNRP